MIFQESLQQYNIILFINCLRKSFKCINNTCIVSKLSSMEKENSGVDGSVDVCRLTCGRYGSLWPKPTVNTTIR